MNAVVVKNISVEFVSAMMPDKVMKEIRCKNETVNMLFTKLIEVVERSSR